LSYKSNLKSKNVENKLNMQKRVSTIDKTEIYTGITEYSK